MSFRLVRWMQYPQDLHRKNIFLLMILGTKLKEYTVTIMEVVASLLLPALLIELKLRKMYNRIAPPITFIRMNAYIFVILFFNNIYINILFLLSDHTFVGCSSITDYEIKDKLGEGTFGYVNL